MLIPPFQLRLAQPGSAPSGRHYAACRRGGREGFRSAHYRPAFQAGHQRSSRPAAARPGAALTATALLPGLFVRWSTAGRVTLAVRVQETLPRLLPCPAAGLFWPKAGGPGARSPTGPHPRLHVYPSNRKHLAPRSLRLPPPLSDQAERASTLRLSGDEAESQVSRVGPWGPQDPSSFCHCVSCLSQDEGWKLLEVLDPVSGNERTHCPQEDSDKEEGRMWPTRVPTTKTRRRVTQPHSPRHD